MSFLDVSFLPSIVSFSATFPKNCGRGESLGNATCLKTVVAVNRGMLPVIYLCSNKSSFCLS